MTYRTFDATPFNEIASHPEVRPWMGFRDPLSPIDMSQIIENRNNFAFLTGHRDGGYLLLKIQPGLYAVHTLALPSARGRPMLKLMREFMGTMFRAADAIEIVAQVPDGNQGAESWSVLAGFRNTFRREGFFPLMGESVGCQFKSLTYGDWVARDRENTAYGGMVAQQIAAALGRNIGPTDPVRDAWIGATIGGCLENNAVKAIGLYNRWAPVAGYGEARLESLYPVTVDIEGALVQIEGGKMDILSAQRAAPSLA